MGLPVMDKVKSDQKGMLLIEIILILLLVLALMKAGFETYLSPYKEAVQEIQKERLIYNGKRLWNR
jgi:hypothetical protein